ncbi:MAG: DUF302 domain-containing protein [Pseudomonadota bacterium]
MAYSRSAGLLSVAVLGLASALAMTAPSRADDSIKTFSKKGAFADVKTDLTETIVNRGLKIDYNGNIGAMLERTGADVGSTKPVYKGAEFFTFCSAKLSRVMMEADPMNLGSCPYVMFIYESVAKPGEVTVGYRVPGSRGDDASKKSLAEVEALLDGIAKEVVK